MTMTKQQILNWVLDEENDFQKVVNAIHKSLDNPEGTLNE